jgi:hypothetical protein
MDLLLWQHSKQSEILPQMLADFPQMNKARRAFSLRTLRKYFAGFA